MAALTGYITTATTTQVFTGRAYKVRVQINKTDAQTIKVIDGTSGTTANVATIDTPLVGQSYEYYGFANGVRIVSSATCDITVSVSARRGGF